MRPIIHSWYNIEICDKGSNKFIPVEQFLTLSKARKNAKVYKLVGKRVFIREVFTIANDGSIVRTHEHGQYKGQCGPTSFNTPTLTDKQVEVKKRLAIKKGFRPGTNKGTIRYIADPEHVPGTESYKAYVALLHKCGIKIYEEGHCIFWGLEKEVLPFLIKRMKGMLDPKTWFGSLKFEAV